VRACAAPAWNNKRRGGTTLVILPTIMPDATATQLANIDYARFVLAPPQLAASSSRPSFVMNKAGPGHMELAEIFSTALGLKAPLRGLDAARRLQSAGAPFTYMTLTNDHLPSTERAHDATLRWERSTQAPEHALGATGAMRKKAVQPLQIDASLDSDVVYHEYGHGLTWRMIGAMSAKASGNADGLPNSNRMAG
jgi:hypothetical protein